MKKLLPLLVFCISFVGLSQDINREMVNGKIIVEGSDIEGITIFNNSSKVGTVTNENGEFTIAVALNDLIEVRALEYQNIDVRVNEAILASKRMSIFLIEEINRLDEVILTRRGLTGNLATDINTINVFRPKMDAIYFGIRSDKTLDDGQLENLGGLSQGQSLVNGLNVINVVDQLLLPLFRSEVKDKKAAGVPEVPVESIKYYLGSTFLTENFNIPAHRVEEFIRYVEDDETFDFSLLNYGKEMQFLELLNEKSTAFLATKAD